MIQDTTGNDFRNSMPSLDHLKISMFFLRGVLTLRVQYDTIMTIISCENGSFLAPGALVLVCKIFIPSILFS